MQHDCSKCGAVLTEHISTVACGHSCRECGRYAYFADQPSYLYLLTNEKLQFHKIGIGTVGKDKNRLQELIMAGWVVYGIWHEGDKGKIYEWEQKVFKELTVQLSTNGLESEAFVGRSDRHWIENISAHVISVSALAQIISAIVDG